MWSSGCALTPHCHPVQLPCPTCFKTRILLAARCPQAQALAVADATGALLKSLAVALDGAAGTTFEASYPGLLAGTPDALAFMAPLKVKPYETAGARAAGHHKFTVTAFVHFDVLPLSERRGAPQFRRPEAWREVRGRAVVLAVGGRTVAMWGLHALSWLDLVRGCTLEACVRGWCIAPPTSRAVLTSGPGHLQQSHLHADGRLRTLQPLHRRGLFPAPRGLA